MDEFTNIGVATVIVILLLREILPYIKSKTRDGISIYPRANGRSGDQSPEYWELKISQIIAREIQRNTDMIGELRDEITTLKERIDRRDGRAR